MAVGVRWLWKAVLLQPDDPAIGSTSVQHPSIHGSSHHQLPFSNPTLPAQLRSSSSARLGRRLGRPRATLLHRPQHSEDYLGGSSQIATDARSATSLATYCGTPDHQRSGHVRIWISTRDSARILLSVAVAQSSERFHLVSSPFTTTNSTTATSSEALRLKASLGRDERGYGVPAMRARLHRLSQKAHMSLLFSSILRHLHHEKKSSEAIWTYRASPHLRLLCQTSLS